MGVAGMMGRLNGYSIRTEIMTTIKIDFGKTQQFTKNLFLSAFHRFKVLMQASPATPLCSSCRELFPITVQLESVQEC